MSELVTYPPAATPGPVVYTDPTGGRLIAWADGLSAAHRIGTALCGTSFVPASFRGRPEEAAAAILYGDEIGLTPTQALQSVHVISGRPGLYARVMVALVMSKGHEVWTDAETPAAVTVCGRRKGSAHVERVTWTTDRARKAGYTSNKKYETAPEAMLYARAASDVCRRIAPDALAGLAYSVEELELDEAQTVTVTRQAAPAATKAQRRKVEPVPAPEPDIEPAVPDEPHDAEVIVTAADVADCTTVEELRALWNEARDPDVRRAIETRVAEMAADA